MLFHVFNSQEERRAYGGSAFIEIQFCKLSTKRKVTERVALRSIQFWQNDSLYVDDEDLFLDKIQFDIMDHNQKWVLYVKSIIQRADTHRVCSISFIYSSRMLAALAEISAQGRFL